MPIVREILIMRSCYSPPTILPFFSQHRCAGMKSGFAAARRGRIRNCTLSPVTKKKTASSRVMMKPMESSIWKDVTGPCPIYMPSGLIIWFRYTDTICLPYHKQSRRRFTSATAYLIPANLFYCKLLFKRSIICCSYRPLLIPLYQALRHYLVIKLHLPAPIPKMQVPVNPLINPQAILIGRAV